MSADVRFMPRLFRDEKGAALVTGIGMGTFLIGATWFIFGIARTLSFRDRVQEAADAGAFSSAVLQAKGMNLIAAVNLVLFAITSIWVVLRTFEHIMGRLQSTVLGNSDNCHGFGCHVRNPCELRAAAISAVPGGAALGSQVCNAARILQEVRDVNKEARQTIGDFMYRTFPALSTLQNATARLAPAAGTVASLGLGAKFGHFTVAMGTSLVPGHDLQDLANRNQGANGGQPAENGAPLGLPVVEKKFGTLCNRTAVVAGNKVKDAFGAIPILGEAVDLPIISDVIDGIINGAGNYIEREFCSDWDWSGHRNNTKIFRESGPKAMYQYASNGSDYTQVWAFTRGEIDDRDLPKVGIASRNYGQAAPHHSNWYISQAEFYFDCTGGWGDGGCNGNDNALYNMRWRARLRRVRPPNIGADLGQRLHDSVLGSAQDALREALGLNSDLPPDALSSGNLFQQSVVDGLFDSGWGLLTGMIPVPGQDTPALPQDWVH